MDIIWPFYNSFFPLIIYSYLFSSPKAGLAATCAFRILGRGGGQGYALFALPDQEMTRGFLSERNHRNVQRKNSTSQ